MLDFMEYIDNIFNNLPKGVILPEPEWKLSTNEDPIMLSFETPLLNLTLAPQSIDIDIEGWITDVKFSYSERTGKITTIVWFSDGDKVTAVPADGDIFKKEKGIEQCILKKLFGSRSRLKKFYKKWCG